MSERPVDLEVRNALLQSLLESSEGSIFCVDRQYRYTAFNQIHSSNMQKMFGVKIALGDSAVDIIPTADDRERARTNYERVFASRRDTVDEATIGDPQLLQRHIRISHQPVMGPSGEITGVIVASRDVTEQKTLEQNHALAKIEFETLFMAGPDAFYVATLQEGKILEVNPAFERSFGYTREEVLGKTSKELDLWADYSARKRMLADLEREGKCHLETVLRRKGGELRACTISTRLFPVKDVQHIMGIVHDVHDQKKAQADLEESRALLDAVIDSTDDWIWTVSSDSLAITSFNRSFGEYFRRHRGYPMQNGLRPEEIYPTPAYVQKWRDFYHTTLKEGSLSAEYEVYDGGVIRQLSFHLLKRGETVFGISVFAKDITERKRSEELVRYQTHLVDSVSDAIVAHDLSFNIKSWNKAAERMYGWKAEETIGQPNSMIPMEFEDENRDIVRQKIRKLGFWQGPVTVRRKDGSPFRVYATVSTLKDDEGQPLGFLVVNRDVTAERKAEQDLRKAFHGAINTMSRIVEMRDPYTAGHQQRVAYLAKTIAEEMQMDSLRVERLFMAASVHDVGKMQVPAEILTKTGALSDLEFEIIKTHAENGYEIIKNIDIAPEIPLMIRQHHERLDGSGYPRNLKGDQIILEARIISVADVVEATASHRPYRQALGLGRALDEIAKNRGVLYDDQVVEACLRLFKEKGFKFDSGPSDRKDAQPQVLQPSPAE